MEQPKQEIIRMVSKHKLTDFTLKEGDFKLVIRNQPGVKTPLPPYPWCCPPHLR